WVLRRARTLSERSLHALRSSRARRTFPRRTPQLGRPQLTGQAERGRPALAAKSERATSFLPPSLSQGSLYLHNLGRLRARKVSVSTDVLRRVRRISCPHVIRCPRAAAEACRAPPCAPPPPAPTQQPPPGPPPRPPPATPPAPRRPETPRMPATAAPWPMIAGGALDWLDPPSVPPPCALM